jgi:hypothetical protein
MNATLKVVASHSSASIRPGLAAMGQFGQQVGDVTDLLDHVASALVSQTEEYSSVCG